MYNTGTVKALLNYTIPISMYYCIHNVFKLHVKSSRSDFLYSSVLLVPIRSNPQSQSQSYFTIGGLPQSVCLGVKPLEIHDENFFPPTEPLRY
jgi:hypothetical protein